MIKLFWIPNLLFIQPWIWLWFITTVPKYLSHILKEFICNFHTAMLPCICGDEKWIFIIISAYM
jgi:hypothetical protein